MEHYHPPVENCYFCKSPELMPFAEAAYWGEFPLHFVRCRQCGLIFANPMPDLPTVFAGNRALNILHTSRGTFSQYRGGKEFTFELQKYKSKGLLLDVGCAEGFFLLGVQENSQWQAEGVEIIESAVEFARQTLGLKVHHGTLDSLQGQDRRYDFIRMNNVIEHVQDPVAFLRKAHQLLKPGGRVYCSTPNGFQDGYFLKTANRRGIRFNLLENHFFYYPPRTLARIFRACGFRVLRHYCEDLSHTLNDLGLLPWFKYPEENQRYKLSDFAGRANVNFHISEAEIRRYKDRPQLKPWKLRWRLWLKRVFTLKFPAFLPLGHQQHVFAEKCE
ncbi:MAG: class I SAM-dependent methyltransferase [Calditrichaeota bacterium]|nr:MAG: class I SAM-dependent methyltransferase [Calditrichota bacterium]